MVAWPVNAFKNKLGCVAAGRIRYFKWDFNGWTLGIYWSIDWSSAGAERSPRRKHKQIHSL